MARVGDRIGNYELLAILGGGGFADVFRARHVTLDYPGPRGRRIRSNHPSAHGRAQVLTQARRKNTKGEQLRARCQRQHNVLAWVLRAY